MTARAARTWLALAGAYVAVAAVMTAPLVNWGALGSASYEGDARFMIWTLAWNNHAVLNRLPLFDANTFYPAAQALAYTDHLFGVSLFTLPVYAATGNPVLAHNLAWLVSFPLCGLAMHLLAWRLTRSHLGALAAGLIYTYSFYRMLHAHGHIGLIWTWPLPLSLWLLMRWHSQPSAGRAAAWALAFSLQALASWYLAIIAIVAHGVLLAWLAAAGVREAFGRRAAHVALAAAIVAAAVLPFARPYVALPETPVEQAAQWSADAAAYLVPPENTWPGRAWLAWVGPGPRWIWGEQTLFLGYVALAFAAAGLISLVRRREWGTWGGFLCAGAIGLLLSFGPTVIRGEEQWSLYALVSQWPGFSGFRTPARYALLVVLAVAVFGGLGAAALARRFGRRGTWGVLALLPVMLSEWFLVGFPAGRPEPYDVPAIYRHDAVRGARALVSLPDYRNTPEWFRGADYLYFSTAHWRPIVNGYGRAEPPEHARAISHMNAFPGPNNARTMRELGVDLVIVHAARYPDGGRAMIEAATAAPEYDLVAQAGTDYAFRVKR